MYPSTWTIRIIAALTFVVVWGLFISCRQTFAWGVIIAAVLIYLAARLLPIHVRHAFG